MFPIFQAETVIREQLKIKETPNMWCFLGDVTRDKSFYEKAWEMSKHHNARSQRCLGYIYFAEENVSMAMYGVTVAFKKDDMKKLNAPFNKFCTKVYY